MISGIQTKIARVNWEATRSKFLGAACGLILAGILVAGLWPFHAPKNQVAWSVGGAGLRFGRRGTIWSSGQFRSANALPEGACSLEIWLEPRLSAADGTIFAFYDPRKPRQFSLNQSITDLALQSETHNGRSRARLRLYVQDIFRQGKPLFVTVTSNGAETSVYVDGVFARSGPGFPLSSRDFDGELIVANSPTTDDSWSGLLRVLAFYDQALSPAQVLHDYEAWTEKQQLDLSENQGLLALYRFEEGSGRVIHNQVRPGIDLSIPEHYVEWNEELLTPFWEEFHPNWNYVQDLVVNVAGFAPLGFIFYAYFSLAGWLKRPALATILFGFAVSLTIEVLQSFLPTRDSGTTDLITNTLGTALGVWVYRYSHWQALFARVWARLVGHPANNSTSTRLG